MFDLGNGLTVEYSPCQITSCLGAVTLSHAPSGLRITFPTTPMELETNPDAGTVTFFSPKVETIEFRISRERCGNGADALGLPGLGYFFAALAGEFKVLS